MSKKLKTGGFDPRKRGVPTFKFCSTFFQLCTRPSTTTSRNKKFSCNFFHLELYIDSSTIAVLHVTPALRQLHEGTKAPSRATPTSSSGCRHTRKTSIACIIYLQMFVISALPFNSFYDISALEARQKASRAAAGITRVCEGSCLHF